MSLQNKKIITLMEQLAVLSANPPKKTVEELMKYGYRQEPLKGWLQPYGTEDNPMIVIEGKAFDIYETLISLIANEPHAEHLDDRAIDKALMQFVKEIIQEKEKYKKKTVLKAKISSTISSLLKPFEAWLVIAPIEGLNVELDTISLGNHFIKKLDEQDKKLYFKNTNEPFDKFFDREVKGRACVFVTIQANNSQSALDKGRLKGEEIINILRVYLGNHKHNRIPSPNNFIAISKASGRGSFRINFQHKPESHIHMKDKDSISNFIILIEDFVGEKMPTRITKRIMRSIRWCGMAVDDEEPEDKLTKYFIALETLLVPEGHGKKGEALAYRTALLQAQMQKMIIHPNVVLDLYEKRSEMVHGGQYEKKPVTEKDIQIIDSLTRMVIGYICQIVKDNDINNASDLISWIENKTTESQWVRELIMKDGHQNLQKYLKEREES